MEKPKNRDTRYFIGIDLVTRKVLRHDFDQKQNLNKGRQNDPNIHRLFLTKGQYHQFVERVDEPLTSQEDFLNPPP